MHLKPVLVVVMLLRLCSTCKLSEEFERDGKYCARLGSITLKRNKIK